MTLNFEETHPEFIGINTHYRDKILPQLIAKEMTRKTVIAKFKRALIIAALLALAALVYFYIAQPLKIGVILAVVIMAIGAVFGSIGLGGIKGDTKNILMDGLTSYLEWSFTRDEFEPLSPSEFQRLGLLPNYDRERYEDEMRGVIHGANFRMHEAKLERKRETDKGSEYMTVFRGVMMEIDFHRDFLGETIVLRDKGMFNRKARKKLKRVGLVDPKFEKIFECYGSDQVEARYLLTPVFMQRLVDLETQLNGKNLVAAFSGGALFIAVDAPNQFEAGSMFKPLTDPGRAVKILNEIKLIFDIADGVLKPNQR